MIGTDENDRCLLGYWVVSENKVEEKNQMVKIINKKKM